MKVKVKQVVFHARVFEGGSNDIKEIEVKLNIPRFSMASAKKYLYDNNMVGVVTDLVRVNKTYEIPNDIFEAHAVEICDKKQK